MHAAIASTLRPTLARVHPSLPDTRRRPVDAFCRTDVAALLSAESTLFPAVGSTSCWQRSLYRFGVLR